MKTITVSQLTGYIKEKLESDLVLSNIWVKGEISNFKHHSSGHMYFTLKDRASTIRGIMFRSRNQNLKFVPNNGMSVIVRGYVTVYERDGQYQLYVEDLQPDGAGALYTAFLQLKEKLEKEGLFDPERKRVLPRFPRKVGVITSFTGAAVKDIINVLTRRYPLVHIVVIPVKVQGDDASEQIVDGILLANKLEDLDVIIVGRGGGSIEELWAFNTEPVARGIYASRIPVISAVGHETDFTIADFVADLRAPTPSAAAEIVVPDYQELQKHVANLLYRLSTGTKNYVGNLRERVGRSSENNVFRRPKDGLFKKMMELDYLSKRLGLAVDAHVNKKKNALGMLMSGLDKLSPLSTLKRGYTLFLDDQGNLVKHAADVNPGDGVEILMNDGSVICTVNRVKEGKYGQES